MRKTLPDKYSDPEGYEAEQARRMRAARLRREAHDRRWRRVFDAERAKPIAQRECRCFAEIADDLACDPYTLAIAPDLPERILRDLFARTQSRQFVAGEVLTLSGNPPALRPFQPTVGKILVPDAELFFLARGGCRRYIEARPELPGAKSLSRDWLAAETVAQNAFQPCPAKPLPPKSPVPPTDQAWDRSFQTHNSKEGDQQTDNPETREAPGATLRARPPLRGKALKAGLDQWAQNRWGPDYQNLPGRDELLRVAREKPEFAGATDQHMRELRSKYATAKSKKGGAGHHRKYRDIPG
jgi:hypothetical protein